jgi:hypothetical protein
MVVRAALEGTPSEDRAVQEAEEETVRQKGGSAASGARVAWPMEAQEDLEDLPDKDWCPVRRACPA